MYLIIANHFKSKELSVDDSYCCKKRKIFQTSNWTRFSYSNLPFCRIKNEHLMFIKSFFIKIHFFVLSMADMNNVRDLGTPDIFGGKLGGLSCTKLSTV